MQQTYTAIVKQDAGVWIGWVEEVPGVTCQAATRDELLQSLRTVLAEACRLRGLVPQEHWVRVFAHCSPEKDREVLREPHVIPAKAGINFPDSRNCRNDIRLRSDHNGSRLSPG